MATHSGAAGPIEVHTYKTQVVAGVNFLAHITIAGADFTVKVHRPLPHTGAAPEVQSCEAGNKL